MSIVLSICYFGTLNSEFMHLFSHHLRYYQQTVLYWTIIIKLFPIYFLGQLRWRKQHLTFMKTQPTIDILIYWDSKPMVFNKRWWLLRLKYFYYAKQNAHIVQIQCDIILTIYFPWVKIFNMTSFGILQGIIFIDNRSKVHIPVFYCF